MQNHLFLKRKYIVKCILSVFLLFVIVFQSYGQQSDSISDKVSDAYAKYFGLPRETLFTHLNKTSFLVGESVWFKTYARDRHEDKVSKATTNINVGLYDSNGKLVKKDLWLAVNGSANGQILLDSTFTTGDYYIKISTNWMRNFIEPDSFIQKITIYGQESMPQAKLVDNEYDIQFLPEGGYMVSGVSNVVGYKVLDKNGKGVKVQGFVYGQDGNELTNFKSNVFGMGRFLFTPEPNRNYTAEVYLPNGTTEKIQLTGIRERGFSLQVNALGPKNVIVSLKTNKATISDIANKPYRLAIHKDGKMKTIRFSFGNALDKTLLIPKKDLFNGVNILTVFDDTDRPIMERIIFNDDYRRSGSKFTISQVKKENDSLVFSIYGVSPNGSEAGSLSDLSISVLPETTEAYKPEHNILTTNYLRPYLKGTIEKPANYFGEDTRKVKYDLDLLLLTQGWSRYNWNDIFNNAPKPVYNFENGLTLSGRVNSPKDISSLTVKLPGLMGSGFSDIEVKPDRMFALNNLYAYNDEEIGISYTDKKGSLKKPNLYVSYMPKIISEVLNSDVINSSRQIIETTKPDFELNNDFFYDEDTVKLNEVLITGTKKKNKDVNQTISAQFTFKDNYTPITEEEIRKFPNILDVIAYNGYSVRRTQDGRVLITNLNPSSPNSSGTPIVYYDGVRVQDFTFLFGLRSNFVEGIVIDRLGFGMGVDGAEGVIRIFSRQTPLNNAQKKSNNFAFSSRVENGFSKSKTFYMPKYKSYSSKAFKQLGTIGWLPNVYLLENKSELFKVLDTNTDNVNFYIEGYDTNGDLVSQVVKLNTE